jgi:glycine cleavage system H protein
MPVSGEITEFNENLEANPEFVNNNPYVDGWMIKVKISHPEEIDELLSADDYKAIIG